MNNKASQLMNLICENKECDHTYSDHLIGSYDYKEKLKKVGEYNKCNCKNFLSSDLEKLQNELD